VLRPSTRLVVAILLVAYVAIGARIATSANSHHFRFPAALVCGVEGWNIKTLKDRPLLLPARATTVTNLTNLPRPHYLPARRLLSERRIFSVIATVTLKRPEDRPRLPPCPAQRLAHDDRRDALSALHEEGDRYPAQADARGAHGRKGLRQGPRRRRRLLGLLPRPDRRRSQRNRAAPVLGFACLSKVAPPPPPPPPSGGKCAASYPTVCIPPPPPDLDCGEIPYRNFRVRWDVPDPDPHRFDGNHDGVGCEG
jgi:hypothetical protein